jgi:hypothetical protein
LGTTRNQNLIHETINKFREYLLPFSSESFIFPSRNLKIKTNKTMIFAVLCGVKCGLSPFRKNTE